MVRFQASFSTHLLQANVINIMICTKYQWSNNDKVCHHTQEYQPFSSDYPPSIHFTSVVSRNLKKKNLVSLPVGNDIENESLHTYSIGWQTWLMQKEKISLARSAVGARHPGSWCPFLKWKGCPACGRCAVHYSSKTWPDQNNDVNSIEHISSPRPDL